MKSVRTHLEHGFVHRLRQAAHRTRRWCRRRWGRWFCCVAPTSASPIEKPCRHQLDLQVENPSNAHAKLRCGRGEAGGDEMLLTGEVPHNNSTERRSAASLLPTVRPHTC